MYHRLSNKDPISLQHKIAIGGEGTIWQTQIPGILAKIFHQFNSSTFEKLSFMIERSASIHGSNLEHLALAWPQDILLDSTDNQVGFLMPRVPGALSLNHVYNPKLRKKNAPGFNSYYLHVTAHNLSVILRALHEKKYVVGDLKTDNFLVTDKALVSAIDVDSFQIQQDKENFYCGVGSEGFTPPELIGEDLKHISRTEEHDRFGLAIIIHLLLLGFHPFKGRSQGDEKNLDAHVKEGLTELPQTPEDQFYTAYKDLNPLIHQAFHQTFIQGHLSSSKRLSAMEWVYILDKAVSQLVSCPMNMNHFYSSHHAECIWCKKEKNFGFIIFPGEGKQQKPFILQHLKQAISENNYQEIISLWNGHDFLKESGICSIDERQKIEKACRFVESLDLFKKFCMENGTAEDILKFWQKDPNLNLFEIAQNEMAKGKSILSLLEDVREEVHTLTEFKKSIEIADSFFQAQGLYDDYLEREIIEKSQNIKDLATLEKHKDRIQQSIYLTDVFKKMALWTREQDFLGAHQVLYQRVGLLDQLNLPESFQDFWTTYKAYEKTLTALLDLIDCNAPEDQILTLWEEHQDFQKTNLVHFPIYGDFSLKQLMENLKNRKTLYIKLSQALDHQNFIDLVELWNGDICTGDLFEKFQPYIKEGKSLQIYWNRVKKGLLEKEPNQVIPNWNDLLMPLVKRENLLDSFRFCFEEFFKKIISNTQTNGSVFYQNNHLDVHWSWPIRSYQISCYWVAARSDRFPVYPTDVEKLHHSLVISHQNDHHHCVFLWNNPKAFVALWPCVYAGGEPIMVSHPFYMTTTNYPQVYYTVKQKYFWGKTRLDIKIIANETIELGDLEIMTSPERPVLSFEKTLPAAVIEIITLQKGVQIAKKIVLDQTIKKNSVFRIYPKDRKILNNISFVDKC